jgi:hypothetical protein
MPAIGLKGEPLTVTGRVKLICDGRYRHRGPASRRHADGLGPSVVLDTSRVEIAVISRHVEPNDINCLLSLGIDPTQKRFLMLKSRVHWRAGFKPMAKAVVECAGTGVCTSDYSQLRFHKVRRPIYPPGPDQRVERAAARQTAKAPGRQESGNRRCVCVLRQPADSPWRSLGVLAFLAVLRSRRRLVSPERPPADIALRKKVAFSVCSAVSRLRASRCDAPENMPGR